MADEPEHEHAEKVATLSLKDLRALVKEAGLSSEDCIEKAQLRLRAAEAVERLLLPGAKLGTVGKTLGLVATEAAPSASGDALPPPLPLPMTLPQTLPLPLTLPLTPASLHRSLRQAVPAWPIYSATRCSPRKGRCRSTWRSAARSTSCSTSQPTGAPPG